MIGIFLLDMIDKMRVQLPIHHQNVIAFILRSLDVSILFLYVGSVQINDMIVLIRLVDFHQIFILFQGKIFPIGIFEQHDRIGPFGKFLICQHAVLDKYLQVIPFFLVLFPVVFEDIGQAVGHFLRNVVGNLLHIPVTLQIGTGYIQRNIRRIDHPMQ